ncbi:MAG TPA: hypothetical protein VM122_11250 [Usitatibacter sp.]|nr:hypothetical protein [Usitatibacter sp.]
MSEMRRAAASLVERRVERFESRYGLEESRSRVDDALARSRHHDLAFFVPEWSVDGGKVSLQATFEPAPRIPLMLRVTSLVFVAMVAASAWVLLSSEDHGALRFLLPLGTALGVLALPFATLALASNRAAREAQVRRAVRRAIVEDDARVPQPARDPR